MVYFMYPCHTWKSVCTRVFWVPQTFSFKFLSTWTRLNFIHSFRASAYSFYGDVSSLKWVCRSWTISYNRWVPSWSLVSNGQWEMSHCLRARAISYFFAINSHRFPRCFYHVIHYIELSIDFNINIDTQAKWFSW